MPTPSILWFRQDLRLADQAAAIAAAAEGPVAPVFVLDDDTPGDWRIGAASRWWLHHGLASLAAALDARGLRLTLLRGRASTELAKLAAAIGTARVHALEHFEPGAKQQQAEVGARLDLVLHPGQTLAPPDSIRTGSGGRYRIFTPFWRALLRAMPPPPPRPAPACMTMAANVPAGERLAKLPLLPTSPDWSSGFDWRPGETGAAAALHAFATIAHGYGAGRNTPGAPRTSRLSPYLHWGEVSAAAVWHAVAAATAEETAEPFLREIGWRDFAIGLLDQFPDSPDTAMRLPYRTFPHLGDPAGLAAWQRGQTGYPIVDAGMRQLWQTGWMHNRVRMIASSFLVKHLLIDWREGARWFWDTLVDADLASNTLGWQWIMGSGVDSQPFNRILEPVGQGRRWDTDGAYVRRWCPELARLPDEVMHAPWEATVRTLAAAGVKLGETYPDRIVDHATARTRALAAAATMRA